jgi:hypothetical protein
MYIQEGEVSEAGPKARPEAEAGPDAGKETGTGRVVTVFVKQTSRREPRRVRARVYMIHIAGNV